MAPLLHHALCSSSSEASSHRLDRAYESREAEVDFLGRRVYMRKGSHVALNVQGVGNGENRANCFKKWLHLLVRCINTESIMRLVASLIKPSPLSCTS
uniref:Uncharacterized protein n=1 Tax=Oryza meridionalis TaxID=40149 RepID=A0A0E0DXZ2_9ORYZ